MAVKPPSTESASESLWYDLGVLRALEHPEVVTKSSSRLVARGALNEDGAIRPFQPVSDRSVQDMNREAWITVHEPGGSHYGPLRYGAGTPADTNAIMNPIGSVRPVGFTRSMKEPVVAPGSIAAPPASGVRSNSAPGPVLPFAAPRIVG